MSLLNLTWEAKFEGKSVKKGEGESFVIAGILLDASVNKNGWAVGVDDLPKVASQAKKGVQLRIDHSRSVRDIIGATNGGEYDPKTNKVAFSAEVDDESIVAKIQKGRLGYVSIGAEADAFCSKCDVAFTFVRECKCKNPHTVIKNLKLKEVSIVSDPAYKNSKFNPVSFVASVNEALAQKNINKIKEENIVVSENKTESVDVKAMAKNIKEDLSKDLLKMAEVAFGPMNEKLGKMSAGLESLIQERETEKSELAKELEKSLNIKKQEEETKKLEDLVTKLVEEKMKKKKPVEDEEEEEEEVVDEKAKKKEGAKVETVEGNFEGESTATWWGELTDAAKKYHIV